MSIALFCLTFGLGILLIEIFAGRAKRINLRAPVAAAIGDVGERGCSVRWCIAL